MKIFFIFFEITFFSVLALPIAAFISHILLSLDLKRVFLFFGKRNNKIIIYKDLLLHINL